MSPIRVDFYLLNDSQQADACWLVACRLLEKAYHRGHRVFVLCDSLQDAEQLDELLWTYKEDSFVPHNLQGEGPEPPPAIQIGWGKEPRGFHDILLNFSKEVPTFYAKFQRIIEIVGTNDAAKAISRAHYRHYRAHQCHIHTHQLNAS